MGMRRQARELVLRYLYQVEQLKKKSTSDLELFLKENRADESLSKFVRELVNLIEDHAVEIDQQIEKNSKNWKISRMSLIDRSLLRMGVAEILFANQIPAKVSMNEAIEIAKKYGTEESSSFINGILDQISKSSV